jgi:hypothetical protein
MPSRTMMGSEPREPSTESGRTRQTPGGATHHPLQAADALRDMGDTNARKLVWFLVPSWIVRGGGVMSICHFHAETQKLLGGRDVAVVASTYPNAPILKKYTAFANSMDIFSFAEVVINFNAVEHVILHIPEYFCKDFVSHLSPSERLFLDTIPRLHVNIMLQNIDLCKPDDIEPLRTLTEEITCTTAHDKYSTQEQSTRFGIPLHKLSVFVDRYEQRPWSEKQDIIVLSPDHHPLRARVFDIIAKGLPSLERVTVENMAHETYRSLIAKAKWSLTFGEGLDFYFAEMAWTGGIPFAVYNDRFFMPQFRGLPTVYDTWDDLQTWIVGDILKLDNDEAYHAAGEPIRQALNQFYSSEKYRENVRLFYDERYSFPGTSLAKPRRVDQMLARTREAIAGLKEREEALNASIAQLREGIRARDASIAERDASIAERDANIAPLREAIAARDASITQLKEARDASIEEFRQSTSWKLTAPLRLLRYGITAAKRRVGFLLREFSAALQK